MVNCNPETVSTDYDTSDRLYFEPLDEEAVLAVLEREQPVGVCIQFGGQTPLKLARAIERAGFRILGTPFDAVDLAEDRERFGRLAESLGVRCPEWGMAETAEQAIEIAGRVGYPVLVRPSYVLGGRAMRVCYGEADVEAAMAAVDGVVLVDRFLESAIELDVDALCDGTDTYVAAVMEHVEEAGHPFRRLILRAAGAVRLARDPRADPRARARARRRRAAERPARDLRWRRLRARGEPTRVTHRSVCLQGDRDQPRRCRLPARGGSEARRSRAPARGRGLRRPPRQGRRPSVRPVRRRRPGARARDALDRRGDGERRRLRDRLRAGGARRRPQASDGRPRLPQRP